MNINNVWSQQDGVACHIANVTIDLLPRTKCRSQLAAKKLLFDTNGLFSVESRQKSIMPPKPETIEHLKVNIHDAIAEIRSKTLEEVHEN